jgi:type II secretory pathway component PulF
MLSEALSAYPDVFDELYVSMFRAGETGGMLAETAARIAILPGGMPASCSAR